MVMLQAYFDDSGNVGCGKTSWLAGYVARTDVWADFADRWHAVLTSKPTIAYFKMSDAFALSEEFSGWSREAANEKVYALIDVVNATDILYGTAVVLYNSDFLNHARGRIRKPFGDPFYYLFTNAVEQCLLHQATAGITERIDFVFDESNKRPAEVMKVWQSIVSTAPLSVAPLFNGPPTFRNEKQFLPLQAADLLAGQLRNYYHRGNPNLGIGSEALKRLGNGPLVQVCERDATQINILADGLEALEAMDPVSRVAEIQRVMADSEMRLREQMENR
jgi:hypothetical protein